MRLRNILAMTGIAGIGGAIAGITGTLVYKNKTSNKDELMKELEAYRKQLDKEKTDRIIIKKKFLETKEHFDRSTAVLSESLIRVVAEDIDDELQQELDNLMKITATNYSELLENHKDELEETQKEKYDRILKAITKKEERKGK